METGTRLGPYEIIEQLGAGGMGEVWLADDSRLGRKVAIKVLPPEFATDPERVARFEQEARAAAALNHPHIAAVFDIGEHDAGVRYIVQEYLQGQSLRHLLEGGALPIKRALRLGTEIAEALSAAHAAGIIHRDIKPDNVFVTPDGHAKVLDFGLAKLTEMSVASNPNASLSPTLLGTIAGQVMGTAGYMSPEQVEGSSTIDHRADLFAFGSLLYEMVSGARAFAGRSVADTLSRIQHDDPVALTELDAALPVELQRIEGKLLAKDPAERYQHAADLVVDLRNLSRAVEAGTATSMTASGSLPRSSVEDNEPDTAAGSPSRAAAIRRPGARSYLAPLGMAVGAVALAAIGYWFGNLPDDLVVATSAGESHFVLELPDEVVALPRGQGIGLAIRPDGRALAFVGLMADGTRNLYQRRLDAVGSERVGDVSAALVPGYSRDGEWISIGLGFTSYARLLATGGDSFPLCEGCTDGTWGDDGNFYYVSAGTLYRQAPDGRNVEMVMEPDAEQGVTYISRPTILPGSTAAVVELGNYEHGGAAIVRFADRKVLHIAADGSSPLYAAPGHILFARESSIFSVPFDLQAFEVRGGAEPVLTGVRVENAGAVQMAVADNGTVVYSPALGEQRTALTLVSREGVVEQVIGTRRTYAAPRVSPDGRGLVAIVTQAGRSDLVHIDLVTGAEARLTTSGTARSPVWSPDGNWLTFGGASSAGGFGLYAIDMDSSATRELHTAEYPVLPTAIRPGGRSLLFIDTASDDVFELVLDDVGDAASVEPFLSTQWSEESAVVSFDGTLLAYESDRTGDRQVYVREFSTGREVQVTTRGGTEPVWSRTDYELFHRDVSNAHWASVRVATAPQLVATPSETLFSAAPYWQGLVVAGYDVTPDGKFVFVRHRDPNDPDDELRVILNFADRLPR